MPKVEGIHYRTGEHVRLTVEQGKIASVEKLGQTKDNLPYIAPGLVDLQINGYKGYDFHNTLLTIEEVNVVTEHIWKTGVTTYYPTITTNSDEAIRTISAMIADSCAKSAVIDATIAGIHLEGPFISPQDGPRGAHAKQYVTAPDWELFKKWQEAAEGRIKLLTLSPEWPGTADFISKCVESGVTVSIGHTAATAEQIREAVAAGATLSTHLGNGAHTMLPRHPNYLWEQLAQDNLSACLIADGFHLPEAFLKVAMAAKQEKAMLVSDVVYLSGLEPGVHKTYIGYEVVLTPEGKLHTIENENILAGSASMLMDGIGHLIKYQLANLQTAWEMASLRPAHFMDLPVNQGMSTGANADLVQFNVKDDRIHIEQVFKGGVQVYSSGGEA